MKLNKDASLFLIIAGFLLFLFLLLSAALFPLLQEIVLNWNNQTEMAEQINSYGWRGIWLLFWLQFLQSILFFIPTAPVQILTGLCYGKFWGTLIGLAGFSAANLLLYILIREFFHIFSPFFKKHVVKSTFSLFSPQLFASVQKPNLLVFLLYAIPGIPAILLPYLLAKAPISIFRFWLFSTIGSIPPIFLYAIIGASIASGQYWLLGGAVLLLGLLFTTASLFRSQLLQLLQRFLFTSPLQ